MIKEFKHKGLQKFYECGSLKGIQPRHAEKLSRLLAILNQMEDMKDLGSPIYRCHQLSGNLKGIYSVTVQANWRLTFKFEDKNVYLLDYQDYH